MKIVLTLLLANLTAMAVGDGIYSNRPPATEEVRAGFKGAPAGSAAAFKTLKGKKGSKGCQTLAMYYKFGNAEVTLIDNYAYGFVADAYFLGTSKAVARYLVEVVFLSNTTDEGVGKGLMAFKDGSRLNWQGTLTGDDSAVLGGAGKYACSTGYVSPADGPLVNASYFDVNICGEC